MLSISALGAAGGTKASYCQDSASQEGVTEGYYQESGEPPGQWHGNGIAALGLQSGQHVSDADFANVLRGYHPETGEPLVQGAGDEHRAGWDLTFSAPKSVSTVWAVSDESMRQAIADAQQKAVAAALSHLEGHAAYARRGKAGAESEKLPGLITAEYEHGTSRALDPDLHTHTLVFNLAQREDGTWGGIESKNLFQWKMAAGAIYRAELAAQMQALGFNVEADKDSFRLSGIPQELCDTWSKRRQEIEAALEKSGYDSAKAAEIASLGTRNAKGEVHRDELFQRWQSEAAEHGFTPEKINKLRYQQQAQATEADTVAEPEQTEPELSIYDKLTQNQSTFNVQDLWRIVAVEQQHLGQGYQSVQARVNELLKDQEIITLLHNQTGEQRYTTRSMLQVEREMARSAETRASDASHALDSATVDQALADFKVAKGFELSAEQQDAVRYITENTGSIQLVRGAAGSGKSTMAEAARLAWESKGFQVRGTALSGKAAQGLEEGSGIKSQTIASLLAEISKYDETLDKKRAAAEKAQAAYKSAIKQGRSPSAKLRAWRDNTTQELAEWQDRKFTDKTVLLVDEAGMVGSRQMQRLLEETGQVGAKIVLIGDERQLQAVDAGGAFRALQNRLGFSELNEVRRQRSDADKQAANNLAAGNAAEALVDYADRGRINVAEDADQSKAKMVQDWLADQSTMPQKLMMAATRADVRDLNDLVRTKLAQQHQLVNEHAILTPSGVLKFAEGDRILFTKNDRELDVKNGTLGAIERITFDRDGEINFSVRTDAGRVVEFSPTSENAYSDINHGYAVTVHKSQGATVDKAYFYASGSMLDKELGYVAMSRHRDACQLYCSAQQIKNQIERSAAEFDLSATGGMIAYADRVAAEKLKNNRPEIADERERIRTQGDSFLEVRDFLNRYSESEIETYSRIEEVDPFEDLDPDSHHIADLKELAKALSRSRAKDTTLDYQVQDKSQQEQQDQQIEHDSIQRENLAAETEARLTAEEYRRRKQRAEEDEALEHLKQQIEENHGDHKSDSAHETEPEQQNVQADELALQLEPDYQALSGDATGGDDAAGGDAAAVGAGGGS